MTGRKPSTAKRAHREVVRRASALAENWSTATCRRRPVAAIESGEICVPVEPAVCTPVHESTAKRMPACPSGVAESRCTGRVAATASSTVIGSALSVLLMRSCGVRE